MTFKIAFIGAGSVGFTRKLVQDLLTVPEFAAAPLEVALHDISRANLGMVQKILAKEIKTNRLPTRLTATTDRRQALDGARYVVNCTRIGGLEAFRTDIDIPLRYRIDQCVGDTLCAGGIMYGQRNIAQLLDWQRDLVELCDRPASGGVSGAGPLLLNYANPMAMNTWACLDAFDRGDGINTVGLCHGVEGGWWQIARALAHLHGDEADLESHHAHRALVDLDCVGINHQTWYTRVLYKGRAIRGDELLEAFEHHPLLSVQEKVRIDVLRRFGLYSTESNGHLSEYLPWYRKRPDEIKRWIDLSSWINGETGGYLRVCTEGRDWFETDFPQWLAEAGKPLDEYQRSSEHGSHIIEALETGRPYRGHFNVRNKGVVTNLPGDCIVEAPGYVDRTGIHMSAGHVLPQACAATCRASIDVQRMGKDAAVTGDVMLLKQAMLHDPLVGAIASPPEVWQLVDEMLLAQAQWLPQYRANGSIKRAKARLDRAAKDGTLIKTRPWRGAARVKTKTVGELRKAADKSVLDADKAEKKRAVSERVAKPINASRRNVA